MKSDKNDSLRHAPKPQINTYAPDKLKNPGKYDRPSQVSNREDRDQSGPIRPENSRQEFSEDQASEVHTKKKV